MKNKRRDFLKAAGMTSLGIASGGLSNVFGSTLQNSNSMDVFAADYSIAPNKNTSIIGAYGNWAAGLTENTLPELSFRKPEFNSLDNWKKQARVRLAERLATPDLGPAPTPKVVKQYSYDGLHIEELTWQLPYGPPTTALLLKPLNATGRLPAILALHDHGGAKYFGTRKITRVSDKLHPLIIEHQREYYENRAWANEMAKRGYVVLVPDAFPFASRRVMLNDIEPAFLRNGLNDDDPEDPDNIKKYNAWAADHEHILSKSLYSAGTTWPGVFFAEDQKALDVLTSRPDVDTSNVGCGGLSGGGMRTVFLAGQDDRIKCAVCVGFMTTWRDFVLHKAYTHTWMTYVPILPKELDFPEILGLRIPLPTMVLNDSDDQLYTIDEMKKADQMLQDVFAKGGASDRYKCSFYPGLHKFDKKMQLDAFDWFDKWLKA